MLKTIVLILDVMDVDIMSLKLRAPLRYTLTYRMQGTP